MLDRKTRYLTYQEKGRAKARQGSLLHLTGCMLYWGEGSKSRRGICFVNSDPNMMKLFIKFLREELCVTDSIITIRIQCHSTIPSKIEAIEDYWLDFLELPYSCLRKTTIKKGNTTVKHKNYENGFCVIFVHRVELVQHILGAIQEYSGFDNPKWQP